ELTDEYILDLTLGNLELAPARSFLIGDPQAILMVEFAGDDRAEVEERMAAMEAHFGAPTTDHRPPTTDLGPAPPGSEAGGSPSVVGRRSSVVGGRSSAVRPYAIARATTP